MYDLLNSTPDTSVMCFDVPCGEGQQCCHTIDYGLAYCCSQMTGFMYLGVMVGGGFSIAILFICCYVLMRGKEKQLEAAAHLEAAKAVNTALSSAQEAIQLAGEVGAHNINIDDLNAPPPSYGDVVRTLQPQRCQSYDVSTLSTRTLQESAVTESIRRQLSDGCNYQHNSTSSHSSSSVSSALPPLPPCDPIGSKLPTYEQCTSAAALVGHFVVNNNIDESPLSSYSINTLSVYPSNQTSRIIQSQDSAYHGSNTYGDKATPKRVINTEDIHLSTSTRSTVTEEMQLSIPTQVDDDTGIIQPKTVVDETQIVVVTENKIDSENNSSVRCKLEFRWNSYDNADIAIGYQNETSNDDDSSSNATTTLK